MAAEGTLPETIPAIQNRCSEDRNVEDAEPIMKIEAQRQVSSHSSSKAGRRFLERT